MNPRFYEDYCIGMRTEVWYLPSVRKTLYRVHAVDDSGEVLLGAQSYEGYGKAMEILGDFLDGELARRGAN